jgi:hypothetical protein
VSCSTYNTSNNHLSNPHTTTYGAHCRSSLVLPCRYFTSRPDLLSRVGGAQLAPQEPATEGAGAAGAAITAAAQRAITTNPAAASRLLSAGINRASSSASGSGNSFPGAGNNDQAPALNVGHVAAAAQAFAPPKSASSPPMAQKGADTNKRVSQKVSSVHLRPRHRS